MKDYITKEKQQYVEAFNDSWKVVFDFFYTQLDFGGASAADRKIHVKIRRFSCAKELITTYGIDAVIRAMSIYSEKLKLGILHKKSVPYFKKIVETLAAKEPEVIKVSTLIPIPKEKVTDAYDRQILNWLHNCPECRTVVDAWDEKCPKCRKFFDWGKVRVN